MTGLPLDVFVQNVAPGAAERLGAQELRARFPRLVTCSISGYGSSGPYRDARAHDLLIQAETGLPSVTGTPEQPATSGIPAAGIGAGAYAFGGVLAALYERESTGRGAALEVSLVDALTEWTGYPRYHAGHGGTPPARTGTSHAAIAPYGCFAAGDGAEVEHPQLAARDRWRTVGSPAGPIRALVPPIGYDGREPRMSPIPDVGADTDRVLRWLEMDRP